VRRTVIGAAAACLFVLGWAGTVFGADDTPTVEVSGVVLDTEGQPAEVESAVVTQSETAGGQGTSTPFDVNPDGTFTVAILERGTPESPAHARLIAYGPSETIIDDKGCTSTTNSIGSVDLVIPGQVPTDPIVIALDGLVGSAVCPGNSLEEDPQAPSVTLPPTDAQGSARGLASFAGTFLLVGGFGLLAVVALLATSPKRRTAARPASSVRRRPPSCR